MKRLSIFVSGNGTNLQRIAEYFADNKDVEIANVVCNNPKAYSIERAKNLGIPLRMITREDFKSEAFVKELQDLDTRMTQYRQTAEEDLSKQESTKLAEISEKVGKAIKEIGSAGGYVYIMDVTSGIPFINETLSTDVTDQVKAKLGIK